MEAGREKRKRKGERACNHFRRLPLSPVSSRFFFPVRPFSVPRALLSRSLEVSLYDYIEVLFHVFYYYWAEECDLGDLLFIQNI